ncbi:cyclic nucleotide-binding domain-containing protein [Candidatus Uabimicrobium sp. HlEnr_7]|uniref:cyclic nucleotide-binding domain-containing protein n=1 Tax=Candidatus Uabimicrobium helgolandensis TaxID=3095367 RepID=UPI003557A720
MIQLVVKKGKETFGEFDFTKDKINIGRLPQNDVVLSMGGISRKHANIELQRDGYVLTKMSEHSEILVGEESIDSSVLSDGDVITIEPFTIKVTIREPGEEKVVAVSISRPKRWAVPYGEDMSDEKVDYILTHAPFKDIDESAFTAAAPLKGILRNDARIVKYNSGDIIIREGDYGNSAFFILQGSVKVVLGKGRQGLPPALLGRSKKKSKSVLSAIAQLWKNPKMPEVRNTKIYQGGASKKKGKRNNRITLQGIPSVFDKYNTASLVAGQIFGEIAAMSRTPRTATVVASEDIELVEIRWQGLRDIRKRAKELKEHIDKIYRQNNLRFQIQETPMFRNLSAEQLDLIVQNTIFETFGDFEWNRDFKKAAKRGIGKEPVIAQEGDYPSGVYMIRSGFARLSQKYGHGHKTLAYLGGGHVYGLEEIAHNWRSKKQVCFQKSLRAVGYTDVLVIPTKIMEDVVLPSLPPQDLPDLIDPSKASKSRAAKDNTEQLEKIGSHLMEFLVENRFINGTATMMINLERCTRCDDCVRACAAAHDNNPKFLRHGPQVDQVMIANACMHCADPVCMLGCPTGAIHRDALQGQVIVNDITCIGCATCANSCPYNNIRMVEIRDSSGNFILENETNKPIVKATKCDLCVDQLGGPACQRACPHDALKRIDMSNLETLANWISR